METRQSVGEEAISLVGREGSRVLSSLGHFDKSDGQLYGAINMGQAYSFSRSLLAPQF